MDFINFLRDNYSFRPVKQKFKLKLVREENITVNCSIEGIIEKTTSEIYFILSGSMNNFKANYDKYNLSIKIVDSNIKKLIFPNQIPCDTNIKLNLKYNGKLNQGITNINNKKWFEFQLSTLWRPLFNIEPDSFSHFIIEAEIPKKYNVLGTESNYKHNKNIYSWDTNNMQILDFAFVIGEGLYSAEKYKGINLSALVQEDVEYSPVDVINITKEIIDYYSKLWTEYPYNNLAIACPPSSVSGNCEREGLIIAGQLKQNLPNSKRGFSILSHEISHSWWGSAVKWDYTKIGYMEALAGYSTLKVFRKKFGDEVFIKKLKGEILPRVKKAEKSKTSLLDCDWETPHSGWLREDKGGCTLLLLEKQIGEKKMNKILQNFIKNHSDGNLVSPEDFQNIFLKYSDKDINDFFAKYFDGTTPLPTDYKSYI